MSNFVKPPWPFHSDTRQSTESFALQSLNISQPTILSSHHHHRHSANNAHAAKHMALAARIPNTLSRTEDWPLVDALTGSPLESLEDDVWDPLDAENVLELADVVGESTSESEAAELLPEPEPLVAPPTAAVISLVKLPDAIDAAVLLVPDGVKAV